MRGVAETLSEVIAANERLVLRQLALQVLLLGLSASGLFRLEGAWWWGALSVAILVGLGIASRVFFFAYWSRTPLGQRWRALALGASRRRERVVELHGPTGEVLHLPVPHALVQRLHDAAVSEGIPVATDDAARARLNAQSARENLLTRIELLIDEVPTPELRQAIRETLEQVRARGGETAAANPPLEKLEVSLVAEHSAQTTTSLRGPNPVYAVEIRSHLAELTRLLG